MIKTLEPSLKDPTSAKTREYAENQLRQPEFARLGPLLVEQLFINDENKGMDARQVMEHEILTKIKTIKSIEIFLAKDKTIQLPCWYFSPLPS